MRALGFAFGLSACTEAPVEAPSERVLAAEGKPAAPAPLQAASGTADPSDVVMGLVAAPGRDQVLANCVACHATALITQNHMSRARWDATLTWMQETQGLWEIPAPDRAAILDYLALTQGVDTSGAAAVDSPWAEPLYRPNPLW